MKAHRLLALALLGILAVLSGPPHAAGDSTSSVMVGLSRSGSNSPRYATWNGSTWSGSSSMSSVGANSKWVMMENCPKRNETACITFDADADTHVMFFNGSSWSSPTEVCTEGVEADDRNCDVAYEQSSGDCLIVYYDAGEGNFGYRTYNGSSLSSESDLSQSGLNENEVVSLYPKPNSDQIMMINVALISGGDPAICANLWNGSSWSGWTTLETAGTSNDDDCVDFAWETNSGDGLLVYGENGSSSPRYRTWNGSAWSSESSCPSTGGAPWWVRLAPDPASDKVLFGGLDGNNDINVNAWTGAAWGSNLEVETGTSAYIHREFDLAFEAGGTEALLVYVENGQNTLRYRTWNGSTWSSESAGTDLGSGPQVVQLRTGTSTGEIFIAASDAGQDIELLRWNGSSMSSKTLIEDNRGGVADDEQFMISVPTVAALTPANIPYNNTFESAMGAEWSSTTRTNNATYTYFAGQHRTTPLRLALNTTVGETYNLVFDFYAIDSWDGTPGPEGPDTFQVSQDGTTLFSHTFVHDPGWIEDGCTHPYSADQYGSYGFNASYSDGVYRKVEVVFTAASSVTTLAFVGALTDESSLGFNDESWGIDNVNVTKSRFLDVSSASGFNVQTTTAISEGSGLHWADLDNDGDLDGILTGGSTSRLMKYNLAGGTFTVSTFGGGAVREQGALADYDNDGDIDFWTCEDGSDGTQRFYANNGSASFTNAGASGFSGAGTNEGCAAADVNADGWPDLAVFSDNGNWFGHNQQSGSAAFSATKAASYGMNDSGDYGARGYTATGDVNNDGRLDFFFRYNNGKLFASDGDGTYTENAHGISILTGGYEDTAAAWGDYDNDGDLDLFVPRTTAGYTGTLWRNDVNWTAGTGTFTNVTSAAGLTLDNKPAYSSNAGTHSGCWGDYDNDGDLDLFIVGANGNSILYQNQGSGSFARVGEGLAVNGNAHDAVFVDTDNDGDLDLAVTRDSASSMLFENRTDNANYLKVRVLGRGTGGTNKAAIGTRVELWNAAGTTRLGRRDVGVARGYGGSDPLWVHFGGVAPATSYKVKVYLQSRAASDPLVVDVTPSGASTTIGSTTIPQMLTVQEPAKVRVIEWSEVRNKG